VQRTAATVSTDGATLFVGAGATVTRVDASTLRAGSVGTLDGDQVLSLAAGHSGWLYALTASGRLLRIDPRTMSVSWRSGPRFIGLTILHQTG
jgi:opacity protein-like surface antigen